VGSARIDEARARRRGFALARSSERRLERQRLSHPPEDALHAIENCRFESDSLHTVLVTATSRRLSLEGVPWSRP
jgi:hypothetical protein